MSSQKIKEVALELFSNRGYEGTSLADIAELVGIKKSSIYNHYKNKDDLFLHIFETCCREELLSRKKAMDSRNYSTLREFNTHFNTYSKLHIINNISSRFVFRFTMFPPYHFIHELQDKITLFFHELHEVVINSLRNFPENENLSEEDLFELASHYILLLKGTFADQLNHQFSTPSQFTDPAWTHFSNTAFPLSIK